jgi:hypothetical protein
MAHHAELVYDAALELLSGMVGDKHFRMTAYSGGSRGHKSGVKPELAKKYLHSQADSLMSHLATTRKLEDSKGNYVQRGGTLPPGDYRCHYVAHHPTFGECIQLLRAADALAIRSIFSPYPIPCGRGNDFFIHGSGPKGSDGCIVPAFDAERRRLNHAVKNFQGNVRLRVKNVSYMLPAELEGQLA